MVILTASIVAMTAYFAVPVLWKLFASTKTAGINTSFSWFADFNFLDNLADLFTGDGGIFGRWMLNSLLYAGVGALGGTFLAVLSPCRSTSC
jgi:multiple sugar transport system permease protein